MRLEQVTPSTPPYPIYLALQRQRLDENESWPRDFEYWANVRLAHRQGMKQAAQELQEPSVIKKGLGLVILGGGIYLPSAYVTAKMMSQYNLPGELWYGGDNEMDEFHRGLFERMGFVVKDLMKIPEWETLRMTSAKEWGWLAKPFVLRHSQYAHVAAFDADSYCIQNPGFLFTTPQYKETEAIFFSDNPTHDLSREKWEVFGMEHQRCWCFESGQMWLNTQRHWKELALTLWMNDHLDFYYKFFWGDKETFCIAWRYLNTPYSMPKTRPCAVEGQVLVQYDFWGRPLTVHRCRAKFTTVEGPIRKLLFWNTEQSGVHYRQYFANLPLEKKAQEAFKEYRELRP